MTSKRTIILIDEDRRTRAHQAVDEARLGQAVTIGEPTRNLEQNALLHALLTVIARRVDWAGKKRDVDTWKRLLTAAWMRARGESVELLPALDGHGVDVVFRHTSTLTKSEFSELTEFIYAWGVENDLPMERPALKPNVKLLA